MKNILLVYPSSVETGSEYDGKTPDEAVLVFKEFAKELDPYGDDTINLCLNLRAVGIELMDEDSRRQGYNIYNLELLIRELNGDEKIDGVVLVGTWNKFDNFRDKGRWDRRNKSSKLVIVCRLKEHFPSLKILSLELTYNSKEELAQCAELMISGGGGFNGARLVQFFYSDR